MKQTIEDLWSGNLAPGPNCGVGVSEMEQLSILLDRNREALQKNLNPEQKELLKKYTDCEDDFSCLYAKQAFCDGFSLGSRLMAEALSED